MKKLLEYGFEYAQDLEPVLNRDGSIREFAPQESYAKKTQVALNKYGAGTFCRFSILPKWGSISGVYAFYIDDALVYVGQALDFLQRFNVGYGNISARCCFVGGQSTNCKINQVVMNSVKEGKKVSVYFYITNDYHQVEERLIKHYNPKYNTMLRSDINLPKSSSNRNQVKVPMQSSKGQNPSIDVVRKYIQKKISESKGSGMKDCIVQSGKIHSELNMKNALPTVCSAMRSLNGDYEYDIIEQPPKENGSRLIFNYKL